MSLSRKHSTPNFPKNEHFLLPLTHTYVCVLGGKKCSFYGKFGVLCFLETPVLRLALLPCYWRNEIFRSSWALPLISMAGRISIKQTHLSLSLSFLSEWLSLSTSYSFKFEFLKYYPGLYQERGAPTKNKDSYDLEQGPLIQSLLQGDNT